MKILHVISGGETGGSKKHLIQLFQNAPFEAELLLLTEGEFAKEAREKGINVTIIQQKNRMDRSIYSNIVQFIKDRHIQVVHSHGPRANFVMNNISSKIGIPWTITVHSDPNLDFLHQPKPLALAFQYLNRRAIKKADHIFAVSNRFKEMLIGYGVDGSKISTIFNGIEFKDLHVEKEVKQLKNEFNINENDFIAVHIARLHPVKGHKVLINAIKKMQPLQDFKLLIVGDGSEKASIESLISDGNLSNHIKMIGFRQDISQLLSLADVSLLTSYSESFPLVLLESANACTPIITTDVGGIRDLIPDSSYGWIVEPRNVNELVIALNEAIKAKRNKTLNEMGELLNVHAKANFSNTHLQNSLYQTYKKIINETN